MTVHKSQGTAFEYRSQHGPTSFCRTWTKRTTCQTGTTSGVMSGTVTSLRIRGSGVMEGNIVQSRLWRHRQLQHRLFRCHGLNNKPRKQTKLFYRSKQAEPSVSHKLYPRSGVPIPSTALTLVSVSHRSQSINQSISQSVYPSAYLSIQIAYICASIHLQPLCTVFLVEIIVGQ
jgi:hypothetical protein